MHRKFLVVSWISLLFLGKKARKDQGKRDKIKAKKLHCDLRVRWKVASDLRFRAAASHPAARGVRQKEFDKKVTKKVTEASEKWPKSGRKSPENEEMWSNSFCRPAFAAPWISEPKTRSFCPSSGDLPLSAQKLLAIAIVRFWRAKSYWVLFCPPSGGQEIFAFLSCMTCLKLTKLDYKWLKLLRVD